ncbi:MAG: hypothetical protein J7M30_08560 [Deltaproteobacteria bacterium]|nr:hypothetical protein [Deltaproteobacteria bacterium]
MHRQHFPGLFFLVSAITLFAIPGCSTTKSVIEAISPKAVAEKILPAKSGLKKRLMVLPLVDDARLGSGRAAETTASLIKLLRKSRYLLVYQAAKGVPLPKQGKQIKLGILTNPDLIKRAEDLGMNALIRGTINPIEITNKKTAFWTWPFRKALKSYVVSVIVVIAEVQHGTIYMINRESVEVTFREDKLKDQDQGKIIDRVLKKAMPRILKRQSKAITKGLARKAWSGRILSVENNTVMINAGGEVGVKPGQEFTVFAQGETIACKDGKSLKILGEKVGKIKVTSIMERHSLAIPVGEGVFSEGQVVRDR